MHFVEAIDLMCKVSENFFSEATSEEQTSREWMNGEVIVSSLPILRAFLSNVSGLPCQRMIYKMYVKGLKGSLSVFRFVRPGSLFCVKSQNLVNAIPQPLQLVQAA